MMMMMTCLSLLFTIVVVVVEALSNPNRISSSKLRSQLTPSHRLLQTSSLSSPSFSNFIMKLTASNGGENDFFGYYNALAISNNRITIIRNWPYYWQVASEWQNLRPKLEIRWSFLVGLLLFTVMPF
jgi:hypothetical protein